ncbi:pyrroline-5-carboxylate reductase [Flexivirga endophytica]|uniref:Pyrroline-5-carboxylate reductase n=2 Tax=Flexivirga endophytica TaxID=1849103 RepID=A0A916WZX0_9MICO|nr:pyrroline-5-carboxylate reductase [Flexivirga endophytica]GHB64094.1 pyrroline-5-carboxylate reductase [Flexivirga endophytica]
MTGMSESAEKQGEFVDRRVAFLGVGMMGEALLSGLLRSGDPTRIVVSDHSAERQAQVAEKYGVQSATTAEAVAGATTVIAAVKPPDMGALLDEIAAGLEPGALVISVAAGITTAYLEAHLPEGTPVVRVMPNTPALVGEGMTAISPGTHSESRHLAAAQDLLSSSGTVISVPESKLDTVTAISGSGPAYVFYVVEAMVEAGVLLGLPRDTSTELVVQTLYGAATMLKETGDHPSLLRERVSSPGGTTIAALRQLDDHKVRAAFLTAMEAAARRSAELASDQG